jgi:chemotaxis protein CheD
MDKITQGCFCTEEAYFTTDAVYLKPGELFSGELATHVTTVLGSCVAITMYDPKSHAAAICHAIQPVCRRAALKCNHLCADEFRSVDCALDEMLRRMDRMGAVRDEMEIKVFGGAAIIGRSRGRQREGGVGGQNVDAARQMLAEYGLSISVMVVGGCEGRKIIFDTGTGAVFLKRIKSIRGTE